MYHCQACIDIVHEQTVQLHSGSCGMRLAQVEDCAPAPNARLALPRLLVSGGPALDGARGSLCAAVSGLLEFAGLDPCQQGLICAQLYNGSLAGTGLGYCTPDPAATPTPLYSSFSVARRTAMGGDACRLPLVHQGNLLLDCNPLNKGPYACFTSDDLTMAPTECEPAAAGASAALDLTSVGGADGLEGSLCYLKPVSSLASLSPTPCKGALSCQPLGGPLAGANLGYCTEAPLTAEVSLSHPSCKSTGSCSRKYGHAKRPM